jgi:hypothetical protein
MTDDVIEVDAAHEIKDWQWDDEPYGWELQLDLYGCDRQALTDADLLEQFVAELVKRIEMVAFGPFECPHFGHTSPKTAGYSFKQWIETSLVSGHEAVDDRYQGGKLYLNVFSCVGFDKDVVIAFATKFFSAKAYRQQFRTRY